MSGVQAIREFVASKDGTKISYLRVGRGQPVVVVHGGLLDATSWLGVAELLADEAEFFLIDLRGHGSSGDGPTTFTTERWVEDVTALLELAGTGAALLGHSGGGVAALETARSLGRRLSRLVVYEAALPGALPGRAVVDQLARLVADDDLFGALGVLLSEVAQLPPEDIAASAASTEGPSPEELAARMPRALVELEAVYEIEGPERYADVTAQTHVLVGELSAEPFQRMHERLMRIIPGARGVVIPGQRHNANLFDTAGTAELLRGLLRGEDPQPS